MEKLSPKCQLYVPEELTRFAKHVLTRNHELKRVTFGPRENVEFALDQSREYKKPGTLINDRTSATARALPKHRLTF